MPEADRTHVEKPEPLDPYGRHGLVVCACGRKRRRCGCHPDQVARRLGSCKQCQIPSPELAQLAAAAAAAAKACQPIELVSTPQKRTESRAEKALAELEEMERRHP